MDFKQINRLGLAALWPRLPRLGSRVRIPSPAPVGISQTNLRLAGSRAAPLVPPGFAGRTLILRDRNDRANPLFSPSSLRSLGLPGFGPKLFFLLDQSFTSAPPAPSWHPFRLLSIRRSQPNLARPQSRALPIGTAAEWRCAHGGAVQHHKLGLVARAKAASGALPDAAFAPAIEPANKAQAFAICAQNAADHAPVINPRLSAQP
jgi:hypothetical protein